jgi:Rieske Fe-S protein
MGRLKLWHVQGELTGKVHLSQYDAVHSINPDPAQHTLEARRGPGPSQETAAE